MSRSYRKFPCFTSDGQAHKKFAKQQANKKVRKTTIISNGKQYRKVFNSWNIVDYKWVCYTNEEIINFLSSEVFNFKPWELKSRKGLK